MNYCVKIYLSNYGHIHLEIKSLQNGALIGQALTSQIFSPNLFKAKKKLKNTGPLIPLGNFFFLQAVRLHLPYVPLGADLTHIFFISFPFPRFLSVIKQVKQGLKYLKKKNVYLLPIVYMTDEWGIALPRIGRFLEVVFPSLSRPDKGTACIPY